MSIISTAYLQAELPTVDFDSTAAASAVVRASGFCNTWTSKHYYAWDDYQASPDLPLAPPEIVQICLELAKCYYYLTTNEENADGDKVERCYSIIEVQKQELLNIDIAPTLESLTISLSSENTQVIGSQNTTSGTFPQVLKSSSIISDSSNVWNYGDDYTMRKGGANTDEYYNAYYLEANSSSVEGTLKYWRTYRNDGIDYMRHSNG